MDLSDLQDFTVKDIRALEGQLSSLTESELLELDALFEALEKKKEVEKCRNDLLAFCQFIDPKYIVGAHHRALANLLVDIAYGRKDRIAVSIPPRHGKSHLVSTLFPAWFLGKFPDKQILMVSHTGDLAVDFGRKVRNLIDTPEFKSVFPGVTLAQDSKSAGRWNTNKGGSYFACIREYTLVHTTEGKKLAKDIRAGDKLLNCGDPVTVKQVYNSTHKNTYKIGDLECSFEHPIWTMTRGWVYAGELSPEDLLCVESIWDKLGFFFRRKRYGYLEYSVISPLAQHEKPLRKSEGRKIPKLRWAWNNVVRTLADLREFFVRYGASTYHRTYAWAGRQQWAVFPGKLSMGDLGATTKQQKNKCFSWGENACAARTGAWNYPGGDSVSNKYGDGPLNEEQTTQKELRAYRDPKSLRWYRNCAVRLFKVSSAFFGSGRNQDKHDYEANLSCIRRITQDFCGLLLGVRAVGQLNIVSTEEAPFVNFLTDGDHTFFANNILTHNCGVGASIAGRGADLLLVDDPHSEQDLLAGNFEALDKAYNWFTFGARTRLMAGGRVAIIHCLVGDTNILMADGSTRLLRDIRPSDVVAGYQDGRLAPARILNWTSQGLDRILTIKTTSGKIVQANEKHPFLVDYAGEPKWTKVRDLKVGMSLIGVYQPREVDLNSPRNENVSLLLGRKLLGCLSVVKQGALNRRMRLGSVSITTTKIVEKLKLLRVQTIGVNGGVLNAVSKVVTRLLKRKVCVHLTTTNNNGLQETVSVPLIKTEMPISSIGMGSVWQNIIVCLKSRTASVQYAGALPGRTTPLPTGKGSSVLTTVMVKSASALYCVIRAISLSAKAIQKKPFYELLNTYELIHEQIAEIVPSGSAEVFDIQVEGTENFIANGLISHNTRWHELDLIGHLVKDGANNPRADQYEVFEFPAILEIETKTKDGSDKVLQKALWPEMFNLEALERTKASMPAFQWNAQYMQRPTAGEGALLKREWWRRWTRSDPPECEYIIMSLDAASEDKERADYTAITTWGVFSDDDLTKGEPHIILLNAINVRVEFPELKDLAKREYKDWQPDAFIVEKKSAGIQLYQELRRLGIPVSEYNPSRATGNKTARVNAIADIVRSGMVWVPDGRRWAEELVEQCVAFPFGAHDDLVDTVSMALWRYRSGGFISLSSDDRDDDLMFELRRAGAISSRYY